MKNTKIISSCLQGLLCGRGGIRGFYFRPDGSRWLGEHLQMSFPVCDKSYAGDDQGQGKSGIEYRDEGVGKQVKPSDGHSQGNHECHDAPILQVEKRQTDSSCHFFVQCAGSVSGTVSGR